MRRIVLLSVAAVAGWVVTPVVDATIRGTIDDRTRAAMRSGHGESHGTGHGGPAPEVDLPGPRHPAEDGHGAPRQGVA